MAARILPLFVLSWAILCRPAAARQDGAAGTAHADTLRVDAGLRLSVRPFVVPGTMRLAVDGVPVPADGWIVDEAAGTIRVLESALPVGTVVVATYRAFPLTVGPVFRLDRQPHPVPGRQGTRPVGARPGATARMPSGLRTRGAVTRGVSAGSGRDVSIESGLRLEIDGSPAPGVEVRAVLTDETTPVRPDGTTQRLSEFDRVAVEIRARPGSVQLGDIDVLLSESRFARFRRKVQGVAVSSSFGQYGQSPASLEIQAAGAAARGLFHVQRLAVVDGMQGPYRLEGRNGELFVLVVPGSEVVYLDGERLERGATRDYTIDYGTGEITFMPGRPVTADRRIEVEFTYTLNQFTRTVVATQGQAGFLPDGLGRPRAEIGVSWLREADGSQFADEFGLSSLDSLLLSQAGDGEAVRSGAVPVAFDPEAPYVQYRREVDGSTGDTVFVALDAAPAPGEEVYRVQFTRVGSGTGRYVRQGQSVNGIVYVYRGPGGGDYDPVRRLPRPEMRRLLDLRGGVRPLPGVRLEGEWARSMNDANRLSALDAADDAGTAVAGRLTLAPAARVLAGRVRASAAFERRSAHFFTFDRSRPVEFGREWNLADRGIDATGPLEVGGAETERQATLEWSGGDSSRVSMALGRLTLGETFDGRRFTGSVRSFEPGRPGVRYDVRQVRSEDLRYEGAGRWVHHAGRLEGRPERPVRPYVEIEREVRRLRATSDSLDALSIAYLEVRPGIAWTGGRTSVSAEIERRSESWPVAERLEHAATAWTSRVRARLDPFPDWSTAAEVAWRRRDFDAAFAARSDAADTRSLHVSWTGDGRPGGSRLRLGWLYQARTERSPTLQEIYLRTGPDRGEYVWVDDNGDGVIQVEEFVPETTPDEGLYVRTFLPSDSLASVTVAQARLRIGLEPATDSRSLPGALSGQTVLEVEERSRTGRRGDVYLLRLGTFRREGTTLNGRVRVRQDLSLFRSDPRFGVDASFESSRALSELAAGTETRRLDRGQLGVRARAAERLDLAVDAIRERKATASEAFASRRFDLLTTEVGPSLRYRWGLTTSARSGVTLAWKNDRRTDRSARIVRIPVTVRTGWRQAADVTVRLEYSDVRVEGTAAGLAAWELTDGRGRGRSFLWGATVQWALSGTLRATLAYDGRAPSTGRVVHTGRMELSAVF